MVDAQIAPTESVCIICHSYLKSKQTGILKISLIILMDLGMSENKPCRVVLSAL